MDSDTLVRTEDATVNMVVKTTDYSIFRELPGNRELSDIHVRSLVKSLTEHGNLTPYFPIVVNERMEVIDGQHRIAALAELGWPVYYKQQEGLGLSVVRDINSVNRIWSWRDYATSYASQGREAYQAFLDLCEKYHRSYTVIMRYSGTEIVRTKESKFYAGEFEFVDYARTVFLLDRLMEFEEALGSHNPVLERAMYTIFNSPTYDHKRMLRKISLYGDQLKRYGNVLDYYRGLEEIYNKGQSADAVTRLF